MCWSVSIDMVRVAVSVKCELINPVSEDGDKAPPAPPAGADADVSGYLPSVSRVPLWYQKITCGGSGVCCITKNTATDSIKHCYFAWASHVNIRYVV